MIVALPPASPFLSTDGSDIAAQHLVADPDIESAIAARPIQQFHPFVSCELREETWEFDLQEKNRSAAYAYRSGDFIRHGILLDDWDEKGIAPGKHKAGVLDAPHRIIDIESELDHVIAHTVHGHFAGKGALR